MTQPSTLKESWDSDFRKAFAPYGYIENDEEEVVEPLIEFIRQSISSAVNAEKQRLIQRLEKEKSELCSLCLNNNSEGDCTNLCEEYLSARKHNEEIDLVIQIIKEENL